MYLSHKYHNYRTYLLIYLPQDKSAELLHWRIAAASAVMQALDQTVVAKKGAELEAFRFYSRSMVHLSPMVMSFRKWPKEWDRGHKRLKWVSSVGRPRFCLRNRLSRFFWARPTGERPRGGSGTCWRDYKSHLAWEWQNPRGRAWKWCWKEKGSWTAVIMTWPRISSRKQFHRTN